MLMYWKRRTFRRRILPALLAVGACLLAIAMPVDARKIALVIGNDSYRSVDALRNARADASAIAATLKDLGFDVLLKLDLNLSGMKAAIRDLKNKTGAGDEIVFYFSGHGVQFEGTNYLVPIDIVPNDAMQVADDSVPLQRVLDDLRDQKAKFSLAIVDACRDNPFKGTGRSIGSRGLAPVSAAVGQMVLYSAAAGQQALDRLGPDDRDPNGVFTRVLLKELRKPGVSADRILKNVQTQVVGLAKNAGHEQVPALYDQTIGDFYFLPPTGAVPAAAAAPVAAVTSPVTASAATASARGAPARERGPLPAYITSSLLPAGTQVAGRLTIHADGSFDFESSNGNHMRGSLLLSDPGNVSGTGMSSLPKAFGPRQRRFPDGSTSTAVQLQGRIADGKLQGTYRTKFETGEFVVSVGDWN
jgi:uncharacterized caspase-like protein